MAKYYTHGIYACQRKGRGQKSCQRSLWMALSSFFSEILTIFINSGAFCSLFKEGCYTYFTCYYPAKFSLVSSPDIYSFFVQSK